MVTLRQRLDNFSVKFNKLANYLPGLNDIGKEEVKSELMKTLGNFSDRVAAANGALGYNVAGDIFDRIGQQVQIKLENTSSGLPENFSNNLGGVASQNISTLMIQAQYSSYGLAYIANTFGMDNPKTQYNFQSLRAGSEFGVFAKGDTVIDQRESSHPFTQITGAAINDKYIEIAKGTLDPSADFKGPIRIRSVVLEAKDANGNWDVIAYDINNNNASGIMVQKTKVADKIDVNYTTGVITATNPVAVTGATALRYKAWLDVTNDPNPNMVALEAGNDHITIEAQPHFFMLRQNLEDIVRMNKEYRVNAPNGLASAYAKTTISQLMSSYIKSIDTDIVRTMTAPYLSYILSLDGNDAFDLTDWENSGNQNLLEGRITQMFSCIENEMSGISDGRRPTAIIADTAGVNALMTNRFFKRLGAGLTSYSDGLVGELGGIKIIRSRALDYMFSPSWAEDRGKKNIYNISEQLNDKIMPDTGEQISVMFAVHKDQANKAASVVFGTYIPPYATNGMLDRYGTNIIHTIETEYTSRLILPHLAIPFVARVSGSRYIKPRNIVLPTDYR